MIEAILRAAQRIDELCEPDSTRPCLTCDHRTPIRMGIMTGPRCLHPLVVSTDLILGLPQLCENARGNPLGLCGPGGHLHSSAPSATTKVS